ncbi:MAG: acetyl-coenzyme A synthetase N-terminal domain-containing protein [Nitrosotalea sp.]
MLTDFAFIPPQEEFESSNIFGFMKKWGIKTLTELLDRSRSDLAWFWDAASDDLGIVWDEKYSEVLDTRLGKPWPKWFVNGRINIYKSCVEKFLKVQPDKIAYIFLSEDDVNVL